MFSRFLVRGLACCACLLPGWAAPQVSAASPLTVRSVHLHRCKAGLIVSGMVVPGDDFTYLADTGWCLRIDVFDAKGKLYKRVFTDYLPRPLSITYHGVPSRSTYSAYLEMKLPFGGSVGVSPDDRVEHTSTDH